MKTLANCSLKDFLRQSNKIRKAVSEYLTETQILEIRKHFPEISKDATEEEKAKIIREQGRKNLSEMLDRMLEENIDATMKIIGLLCFAESEEEIENIDPFSMFEIIFNERVINFFISLKNSGLIDMENTSQK